MQFWVLGKGPEQLGYHSQNNGPGGRVRSKNEGSCGQWCGGSEAAGEAARLMVPPPSHTFFASWSGMRVMSWAQHAMTVGHCAIHLGGWGCLVEFKV